MKLRTTMFPRLRLARRTQLFLWLAAFVSVGGSLGLHPEPGEPGLAVQAPAAGREEAQRISPAVSSRHPCVACLSHRPVSVAPVLAAPSARLLVIAFAHPFSPEPLQRLETSNHEGRAPPVLL